MTDNSSTAQLFIGRLADYGLGRPWTVVRDTDPFSGKDRPGFVHPDFPGCVFIIGHAILVDMLYGMDRRLSNMERRLNND